MAFIISNNSSWLTLLLATTSSSNININNTNRLPTRFKLSGPTSSHMLNIQQCHLRSNSYGIQRNWVQAEAEAAVDQSERDRETFTVASYNILGDRNASQYTDLYVNIPSRYIDWDRRKRVICDELLSLEPHIICLQEVDKYFELSNILAKAGYMGSFKRRTGDSVDGCAMFWKANKFRLLDGESIQYKDIGLRDNVAQLLVFELISLDNYQCLLLETRNENSETKQTGPKKVVYVEDAFLKLDAVQLQLNVTLYDRKELSGQKHCRPALVLGEMKDAVGQFISLDGYSDGVVPTRVLDTVPISDLVRAGGLPCKKVGSDHLVLVSEFSFSVAHTTKSTDVIAAATLE